MNRGGAAAPSRIVPVATRRRARTRRRRGRELDRPRTGRGDGSEPGSSGREAEAGSRRRDAAAGASWTVRGRAAARLRELDRPRTGRGTAPSWIVTGTEWLSPPKLEKLHPTPEKSPPSAASKAIAARAVLPKPHHLRYDSTDNPAKSDAHGPAEAPAGAAGAARASPAQASWEPWAAAALGLVARHACSLHPYVRRADISL